MNREIWSKVSIGLNVILIGAVLFLAARRPESPPASSMTSSSANEATTDMPEVSPAANKSKPSPITEKGAGAADWKQWIEPMRAGGVPNRILARLILSEFEERWMKREEELQKKFADGEVDEDAINALVEEHDREQEKELRASLGEEGYREWDRQTVLDGLNLQKIKLTGAETNTIYALAKEMHRQFREFDQSRRKGNIDETDFTEQQSKVQAAFDQKLKTLLGDERYAAMQGIEDKSVELRRSLKSVNPTDTQFQALLDVQRQWTERRSDLDRQLQDTKSMDAAYAEQIQAIDQARDQEYQRVLGTNAFDAYQRSQDGRYNTMKRYANAWGLDDQNIDYIYRTVKYYEKSVEDYRREARLAEQRGQPVDWEAVNKNLQQFSEQTGKVLETYLGSDRFNKLNRNQVFPFEQ